MKKKTIAFHLHKGGVGKTSISGATGYEFSKFGKTLLIDADPQANLTSWFLGVDWFKNQPNSENSYTEDEDKIELADVLLGKKDFSESFIKISDSREFYILPTRSLSYGGGQLKTYGENGLGNEPYIFEDLVIEAKKEFDFIIFDLSPGISRLERCVILATDEVVVPMTPETFSLYGIQDFHSELSKLNKQLRRNVNFNKIIVNNFNRSIKQHVEILEAALEMQNKNIYTIPVDPAFRKTQFFNLPLQEMPKTETCCKPATLESLKLIVDDLINNKNKSSYKQQTKESNAIEI